MFILTLSQHKSGSKSHNSPSFPRLCSMGSMSRGAGAQACGGNGLVRPAHRGSPAIQGGLAHRRPNKSLLKKEVDGWTAVVCSPLAQALR